MRRHHLKKKRRPVEGAAVNKRKEAGFESSQYRWLMPRSTLKALNALAKGVNGGNMERCAHCVSDLSRRPIVHYLFSSRAVSIDMYAVALVGVLADGDAASQS